MGQPEAPSPSSHQSATVPEGTMCLFQLEIDPTCHPSRICYDEKVDSSRLTKHAMLMTVASAGRSIAPSFLVVAFCLCTFCWRSQQDRKVAGIQALGRYAHCRKRA